MSGSPLTAVAGYTPSHPFLTMFIAAVAGIVGGTVICRTLIP
jgi:hypothetical protein